MPFTPFHLGPGALAKSLLKDRFSFMVFGGSQVLMDIEALIRIALADPILHGPSHSIAGAAVIGLIAGALGRPISLYVLEILRVAHRRFSWRVSFSTAFIGTFSHIVLDAIMHADMRPLFPFSDGNGLLDLISSYHLHLFCLICAVFAGVIFCVGAMVRH